MLKYKYSNEFFNDEHEWKKRIVKQVREGKNINDLEELIREGIACDYMFPIFLDSEIEAIPQELRCKLR